MNLFLSTRKLAKGGEENHLTEFFAAALFLDEDFRQAYAALVLAPFAQKVGWNEARIVGIDTQRKFEGHSSCPDMALTLADGHIVICEHKLEAGETLASVNQVDDDGASEGSDQKELQLARYLKLPIDGMIYVCSSLKAVEPAVLEHPKYISPTGRQHFLWRDFYLPLAESSSHPLCRWLREGFEDLGFTPPQEFVGDLEHPDNQKNFAKFWTSTKARAHDLGWHVGTGAVVELYLDKPGADVVTQVWVCPRNEKLLFRVTPSAEARLSEIANRLRTAAEVLALGVNIARRTIRRTRGNTPVVDVWAPLRKVLGESASAEETESRLFNFVVPFLSTIS